MIVNFLIATACEADPIKRHFRLQSASSQSPFAIYSRGDFNLIVTGIGILNAAIAATYLGENQQASLASWVNVGVAGHPDARLGELFGVKRVVDSDSAAQWNLAAMSRLDLGYTEVPLVSTSTPEFQFKEQALYDQESSGICAAGARFGWLDRLSIIKIVSDNREQGYQQLSKNEIHQRISAQIKSIDAIVSRLSDG